MGVSDILIDYVKIDYDVNRCYGGFQCWFDDKSSNYKIRHLFHGGCGVISASDLMICLSRLWQNELSDKICTLSKDVIPQNQYLEFVKEMSEYVTPKSMEAVPKFMTKGAGTIGVFPQNYINGIKRYIYEKSGISISPKFIPAKDNRLLSEIKNGISTGIPVPLKFGWGKGIQLYNDNFTPNPKLVKWHGVNVIGSFEHEGENWLIVASWGQKFFLKFGDYIENSGIYGGAVILVPS